MGFRSAGVLAGLIVALGVLVAACGGNEDGIAVGDDAPGFSLESSSGGRVALDDYEGHDVLLYFHMADG